MIAHTPLQTMLLVDAVEERVRAPVEAWPTSILKILTFEPYMPFARDLFTKHISFVFGNHVPLPIACLFLSACSFLPPHLVTPRFSYLYNDWSLFPSNTTRFPYYMYEKMWKYTDGTTCESAFPPPTVGLKATGFPTIARLILLQANQLNDILSLSFRLQNLRCLPPATAPRDSAASYY